MKPQIFAVVPVAAALVMGVVACSGSDDDTSATTPNVAPLFPANNQVGSWIEDAAAMGFSGPNPTGIELATTYDQAVAAVDGDADVFNNHKFVAFGREFYTDGSAKLELRVWQMADAAAAKALYDGLPGEDSRYNGTWTTASFGDAGRMSDTGVSFWYNVVKKGYFIEIQGLKPNDAATKTAGETFLTAVLAKVP